MSANEVLLGYQARVVELDANAAQLRFGQLIALLAISVAVLAILALVWLSVAQHSGILLYALLPVPLMIVSTRVYKKRGSGLQRSLRSHAYYKQGIARLEGRWAGLGIKGEEFTRADHVYDKDLDLFGEGSFFELLCTCRTQVGRRQLVEYLFIEPNLQDALERQAAVQELQNRSDLREKINLLGEFSFQDSTWNTITDWVKSPAVRAPSSVRAVALGTSICLAMFLLLGFDSVLTWSVLVPWIVVVLVFHTALGLFYRTRLLAALPAIHSVGSEIGVLREGLRLLQYQKFNSPLLTRLAESCRRIDGPSAIGKLQRFIGALTERNKEWFYAIHAYCWSERRSFGALKNGGLNILRR